LSNVTDPAAILVLTRIEGTSTIFKAVELIVNRASRNCLTISSSTTPTVVLAGNSNISSIV